MALTDEQNTEQDQEYLTLGRWQKGIVNKTTLKTIPNDALLDALNIDIDNDGAIRRRKGYEEAYAGADNIHSVYSNGKEMLFIEGQDLCYMTELDDGSLVSLSMLSGFQLNAEVSYLDLNDYIYLSNGYISTRYVKNSGSVIQWGIENPNPTFNLSAADGNLSEGTYQVNCTFINNQGEESGCKLSKTIDLVANQSIVVDNLPQPLNNNISFIRVYVSEANGSVLYQYDDLVVGTNNIIINKSISKGIDLKTQFLYNVPAGNIIEHYNGRILIANGKNLYFTEAFRPNLYKATNHIQFSEDITIIKSVSDGFFVCADKTYFIGGDDITKAKMVEILPYGGVRGTAFNHPYKKTIGWFSERGQIVAGDGGKIENVSEKTFIPNKYEKGSVLFKEENGIEQIVNLFRSEGEQHTVGMTDYADAIVRKKNS